MESEKIGTFTDPRDGKVYKTVKIGNQIWMAENLAYNASSGCWTSKNDESYESKYGYLYDWETALKVCPIGWHLPSDDEWNTLVNYLGGESIAGGKMKAIILWQSPNKEGTNSSGFSALPAGFRDHDGSLRGIGTRAFYYSNVQNKDEGIRYRLLEHDYAGCARRGCYGEQGFSVRCIKD